MKDKVQPELTNFLTAEQTAQLLNISRRTLHRWGRQRKGPPRVKIGRSIYYREAALQGWLLQNEESYSGAPGCTGGEHGAS